MEEETYTVVIDGKPQGPYQLSDLKALNIKPGTFIRKPGMSDYKEAHELPELRSLLGFKFEKTLPQYFAAFDQRVVADVVDYLVIIAGYLLIMAVVYLFADLKTFRIFAGVLAILVPWARLIYGSIVEASEKQATIGKRLMDLKVTDAKGYKLTLANSFGRNFAKIISNLTLGFGYLYCFLNKKQQCIHDVIADTLVIKERLF